jgi:hypothetical protein
MSIKKDEKGFGLILLILAVAVISVVVYSFLRTKAKEQGLELPFGI